MFVINNFVGNFFVENIVVIVCVDKLGLMDFFILVFFVVDQNWNSIYGYFLQGVNDIGYLMYWNFFVIIYYGMQICGVFGLLLLFQNFIGYLFVVDVQDGIVEIVFFCNGVGEYMFFILVVV